MLDRERFSRITLSGRLLIPAVLAAVLSIAMVQAWTLQVSQRELEARMQDNVSASMALLKAYLAPLGHQWSRVADALTLGSTPLQGQDELVDLAVKPTGGVATLFDGDRRIATNIHNADGSRAIGTRLADDAVRQAVLAAGPRPIAACQPFWDNDTSPSTNLFAAPMARSSASFSAAFQPPSSAPPKSLCF